MSSFVKFLAFVLPLGVLGAPASEALITREVSTLPASGSALLKLKQGITSDFNQSTADWFGSNPCSYTGVSCEVPPDSKLEAVASLDFNGFQLEGDLKLDPFLRAFPKAAVFHFNSNGFSGSIPKLDLKTFPYLFEADFSNNKLSGSFPVGALAANLTFLDIRFNSFQGPVPAAAFTSFEAIEVLFLNDNQFDGKLPDAFENWPGLYLTIANNNFSGSIPKSLGSATNLQELVASDCKFSGAIPKQLAKPQALTVLDFSQNLLTGGVPESLCEHGNLEIVNFSGNRLNKPLGPRCQALVDRKILDVSKNCIAGQPDQRKRSEC